MKLPKHIIAALGRPRCVCRACGATVEIIAKGTIARHRGRHDPYASVCAWSGQTAPEGGALEWLRRETASQKARAESFRADAERATKNAEHCDAMAAELEKIVAGETGK